MARLRTGWRTVALVSVVLGAVVLAYVLRMRPAEATVCPVGCDYCSADPVFVQPDQRKPEMIEFVRRAKASGAVVAETKSIVLSVR